MPVRLLNSAVFKWPDREVVLSAARAWAVSLAARDPLVSAILCIGSCARGDYGVGSDLDVIVLIDDAKMSLVERRRRYEPTEVPVPADVTVYTSSEWSTLRAERPILVRRMMTEGITLFERLPPTCSNEKAE